MKKLFIISLVTLASCAPIRTPYSYQSNPAPVTTAPEVAPEIYQGLPEHQQLKHRTSQDTIYNRNE